MFIALFICNPYSHPTSRDTLSSAYFKYKECITEKNLLININIVYKVIKMAKARARAAARKIRDKWRAKSWYNVLAPPAFDNVTVAETLTDNPDKLIGRVAEVSLQDITNDFRKSHITLYFKINKVEENNAHTEFVGHSLTSDYIRRMIRRRKSKIDGVYDLKTKDNGLIRVKPFAITEKRIQNSQKKIIRNAIKKTITEEAAKTTMSEFVKNIIDGKIGSEIYKNCKKLYPVKRIEINKTEVLAQPTIETTEKKPKKKEEKTEEKPEEDKTKIETEKKTTEKKKTKKEEAEKKPEEPVDKKEEKSKTKKTEDTKKTKKSEKKEKKATSKKTTTTKKKSTKKEK